MLVITAVMLVPGLHPAVADATETPRIRRIEPANRGEVTPAGGYALRLAGFVFDPAGGLPQLPDGWSQAAPDEADLHLVQLNEPTRAASLSIIKSKNLNIVQYVFPYTYIVWGRASDVADLALADGIRATAGFAPA